MTEGENKTISDLRGYPDCVEIKCTNGTTIHESCLQSYQVLEKVKYLCTINTPCEVILEIIQEAYLNKWPNKNYEINGYERVERVDEV